MYDSLNSLLSSATSSVNRMLHLEETNCSEDPCGSKTEPDELTIMCFRSPDSNASKLKEDCLEIPSIKSMESSSERLDMSSDDESNVHLSRASSRTSIMDLDEFGSDEENNSMDTKKYEYACLFCKHVLSPRLAAYKHYLTHLKAASKAENVYVDEWIETFLLYQENMQRNGDNLPESAVCPVCSLFKKLKAQVQTLADNSQGDYLNHIFKHCCYFPFQCIICELKCINFMTLKQHMQEKHPHRDLMSSVRLRMVTGVENLIYDHVYSKPSCRSTREQLENYENMNEEPENVENGNGVANDSRNKTKEQTLSNEKVPLKTLMIRVCPLTEEQILRWTQPRVLRSKSSQASDGSWSSSTSASCTIASQPEARNAADKMKTPSRAKFDDCELNEPACVRLRRNNGLLSASKEIYYSTRSKNPEDHCDPEVLKKILELKSFNVPNNPIFVKNPYYQPTGTFARKNSTESNSKKKKKNVPVTPRTFTGSKKAVNSGCNTEKRNSKNNGKKNKCSAYDPYSTPRHTPYFGRVCLFNEDAPKDELTEALERFLSGEPFFVASADNESSNERADNSFDGFPSDLNDGDEGMVLELMSHLNNLPDIFNANETTNAGETVEEQLASMVVASQENADESEMESKQDANL